MSRNIKYSHDDRKYIAQSIENLKNAEDYVAIFEILMSDDPDCYNQNGNGVFLNVSVLSDKTLSKIKKYLDKIKKSNAVESETDIDIIPNTGSLKNDRQYKLSNYEKNIIKQRNLKKVLNEDNEYEELKFTAKKSKKITNTNTKTKSKSKNCAKSNC